MKNLFNLILNIFQKNIFYNILLYQYYHKSNHHIQLNMLSIYDLLFYNMFLKLIIINLINKLNKPVGHASTHFV